jgi:hypothetical protein
MYREEDRLDEPPVALHQAILGLDVEGYSAGRSNPDQLAVRAGFYRCLRAAFGRSRISWGACYQEDRGDGALVLILPQIPKGYLVVPFLRELSVALRTHNEGCESRAIIRMRLVLHAGEVLQDSYGVADTAVNVAFRLLEAAPLSRRSPTRAACSR